MTYTEFQRLFDAAYPAGHQYSQKDHFLQEISDAAINIVVEHFARVLSPLSLPFFQHSGGAMQGGTPPTLTAQPSITWPSPPSGRTPGESPRRVRWTWELWQALRPATGGVYVNHIGREAEDGSDQVGSAYGAHYSRLGALKQQNDPTNLFCHNQNIQPT